MPQLHDGPEPENDAWSTLLSNEILEILNRTETTLTKEPTIKDLQQDLQTRSVAEQLVRQTIEMRARYGQSADAETMRTRMDTSIELVADALRKMQGAVSADAITNTALHDASFAVAMYLATQSGHQLISLEQINLLSTMFQFGYLAK